MPLVVQLRHTIPEGVHLKTIHGDLVALALQGEFDVIVHGCNCFHTMGAGIAKTMASKFPEALAADRATSYGDTSKLGTISTAQVERGQHKLIIVNAYTQFHWKGSGRKVDYEALGRCFREIANSYSGSRIGYPLIGAGLAGGDWTMIAPRIDQELAGLDHTLVIFGS